MGAHHSNDKSRPSFKFENKSSFPYDTPSPFENDGNQSLPNDLSCFEICIPCAGSSPELKLLKESWINGCPNPDIPNYSKLPYTIEGITHSKYIFPYFRASGQYSIIRLTKHFTKLHLVNTSEVEDCVNRLRTLYENDIDPGTFPSFIGAPESNARYSGLYQRVHLLVCRLVYHQIMCKNQILYFGSAEPTILTDDGGVKYVLVQHPSFHSQLLQEPQRSLFPYYPLSFLRSLQIKSYDLHLLPLNLIRSAFSFHRHPSQIILKMCNNKKLFPGSPKLIMPFSLLYLDCLSDTIHTVYSFILHHLSARNTALTVYNINAPVIVVMSNSAFLDRGLIDESTVLEAFGKYLFMSPIFYHISSCPPQQPAFNQLPGFFNTSFPSTHYFDTPCDASTLIPSRRSGEDLGFSNEDFKRSCDDWLQVLNSIFLSTIVPSLLPPSISQLKSKTKSIDVEPADENQFDINSFALFNPSNFRSILPLIQSEYPALVQRFQWHNLEKLQVELMQLSLFTCCCIKRESDLISENKFNNFNYTYEFRPFKALSSRDLIQHNVLIGSEYLVDVCNQTDSSSDFQDSYAPVEPLSNSIYSIINTRSLQNSHSHVKMFSPSTPQLTQIDLQEQIILEQLDERYQYSLVCDSPNPPTESIVMFNYEDNRAQSYSFNSRSQGKDKPDSGNLYTASLNYFTSSQNKNIEIQITSPDFLLATTATREKLPIPLPNDVSTAYCALPMNKILAIDAHISKTLPHVQKQSRYLVQMANHFHHNAFSELPFSFHSYLCPAICIMSLYDVDSPYFTAHDTEYFDSCRESLLHTNINIALIFVFVLPEHFDIQYDKLPDVSQYGPSLYSNPLYGWDFECTAYRKANTSKNQKDKPNAPKESHSPDDTNFHRCIILQRMKHTVRYLTEPKIASGVDDSKFAQRSVYYFVVKGLAGYFECLPRINQCALAHFFSFGVQH